MSKILIVEDNEMNRDMLSRRLERKGFEVVMAEDGAKGVEMSKSENPDLILRFEIIYGSENANNSNLNRFNMVYYPRTSNNIVGAVLIELIDNNTNKLIWQSSIDADNAMKKRKGKDPLKKLVIRLFNTYLYQARNAIPNEQLMIK